MEVRKSLPLSERLKNVFLKEPVPFASKREVNWKAVQYCGMGLVVLMVVGLLLMPAPVPEQTTYHERAEPGSTQARSSEAVPSDTTLSQLEQARGRLGSVPRSLEHLYAPSSGGAQSDASGDRNSSMIITRGGLDLKTQVPPGSRIRVKLIERTIVAGQAMPVIGVVAKDFIHEDSLAVPEGAKVFGEASFDDGAGRAQISWRAIQMPDGRERAFSAITIGRDGQVGMEGKVHSDGLKNSVGHTLTKFIGAYAEGSTQRGALGSNPGGSDNGLKNAVAETAKDRAEAWAEDLKKERRWIELPEGSESFAVLKEPFTFKDPGGHLR